MDAEDPSAFVLHGFRFYSVHIVSSERAPFPVAVTLTGCLWFVVKQVS